MGQIADDEAAEPMKNGRAAALATEVEATAAQKAIITFPADLDTILKVIAGPGSGKTFTLVKRIEYLIEHRDLKPNEILVLSMSNRAVNALKDALGTTLGEDQCNEITINTFHSFCGALIDQFAEQYSPEFGKMRLMDDLSWRNFSSLFLGSQIMLEGEKIHGSLTATSLEKLIFDIKSERTTVKQAAEKAKISEAYLRSLLNYMNQNGMMRYHDLLTNALQLINLSLAGGLEQLIPQLQNYRAVVVDEFQDIYDYLLKIVTAVVEYPTASSDGKLKHLTIAGDPNQSIYEFLGAKPELLQNLQMQFPSASIIEMQINESFRSTQRILDASTQCLNMNVPSTTNPNSTRGEGFYPIVRTYKSEVDEITEVGKEIIRLILELGGLLRFSDFTILTRSNKEIESIAKIFKLRFDIKCLKLPPNNEWINSKLHMLLDVINVLGNSSGAEFSLLCLLSVIDTSSGSKSRVSQLFNYSSKWAAEKCREAYKKSENVTDLENYLLHEIRENYSNSRSTSKSDDDKLRYSIKSIYKTLTQEVTLHEIDKLLTKINQERNRLLNFNCEDLDQVPNEILQSLMSIIENLRLIQYINEPEISRGVYDKSKKKMTEVEYKKLLEKLLQSFNRSLRNSYLEYIKTGELVADKINFLRYFLRTYNDEIPAGEEQMIKISTIHTAKGLEFPIVFIISTTKFLRDKSIWESLLVSNGSPEPSKSRIFYVGCTRARNLLYIGSTKEYYKLSDTTKQYFKDYLPILNKHSPMKSDDIEVTASSFASDTLSPIENLAKDLNRQTPSDRNLKKGAQIYQQFMNSQAKFTEELRSVRNKKFHSNVIKRGYHSGSINVLSAKLLNVTIEQKYVNSRALSYVNSKPRPTSVAKLLTFFTRHC